jgi:hypothetical protein
LGTVISKVKYFWLQIEVPRLRADYPRKQNCKPREMRVEYPRKQNCEIREMRVEYPRKQNCETK